MFQRALFGNSHEGGGLGQRFVPIRLSTRAARLASDPTKAVEVLPRTTNTHEILINRVPLQHTARFQVQNDFGDVGRS